MRTCLTCGERMVTGYLIEDAAETFCSDACIDAKYPGSSVEMANMTDEDLEDSNWYWTDWECDNDLERISYDEAKERFLDDQKVYLLMDDETEALVQDMDDIVCHEALGGSFGITEDQVIIHEDVSEITCPHCGHENQEEKSELLFENEIDCEGCSKRFAYNMSITYSSFKLDDDGPGEPGECPRCFHPMESADEDNSICRIDNETVICNDCGTEQAFAEMMNSL